MARAGDQGIGTSYDASAFADSAARYRGLIGAGGGSPKGVQATPSIKSPAAIVPATGLLISQRRADIEQGLSALGVDAAYFATMQSGNTALVVTGTITEAGSQSYSYDPEPGDRLRIAFASGENLEYRFSAFDGDFSQPDGARFLRKDHDLGFRLSMSSGTEVDVSMKQQGGVYRNTVNGQVAEGIARYDVATETNGEILSDVAPPGVDFHSRERITGKISTDGFAAEIDEFFRYHVVIFENAIEDIEKTVSNRWTIGDDAFELADSRVFRTFKNGIAAELDSWQVKGRLTRNGQEIGGLGFEQTATTVDTVLTADGEKTVLFSDRVQ
jgi:hypothetical protein